MVRGFIGNTEITNQDQILDAIVDGTLTKIECDINTVIRTYCFYERTSLVEANFQAVTSIGTNAFEGCTSLTSINLPSAQSIATRAFDGCSALTSINLPNAKTIGASAFSGCDHVTSVNLPEVTQIASWILKGVPVTSLSLPKCTAVPQAGCQLTSALNYVYLPKVTEVTCGSASTASSGGAPFQGSANNATIVLGDYTSRITFKATSSSSTTLIGNSSSATLYLRSNSLPAFSGGYTSGIVFTGFSTIYVKPNLVTTYTSDSRWSAYADRIQADPDYSSL